MPDHAVLYSGPYHFKDAEGMDDSTFHDGPRPSWRARRQERTLDKRALRAEFEIDRPRGFARVRAFVAEVGELEAARLRAHDAAAPQRAMAARAAVNRRSP